MPGFETIGEEERAAVNEVFDDGGILFRHGFDGIRKGRYRVMEFQKAFAERMGAGYAVAVTSGTAAVKVALKGLGIKPGDEVITQSFTFVATVEAILDVGAIPVVINIDDSLNMDPAELEKAITPATKAIIPVHMLGVAANMDRILAIAQQHSIPVIEDNAQSIGAKWNEKHLGTLGKMGTFSLDFGKVITTGEGGMVVTDDEELYKLLSEYHDHGHANAPGIPRAQEIPRIYGFNYRMNELQAAIGLVQIKKLSTILADSRKNHDLFLEGLRTISGLKYRAIPEQCTPVADTIIFTLPSVEVAGNFTREMYATGLGTKMLPDAILWHFAAHWEHMFSRFGLTAGDLKEKFRVSAERLGCSIAIPIMLRDDQAKIEATVEKIRNIAKKVL